MVPDGIDHAFPAEAAAAILNLINSYNSGFDSPLDRIENQGLRAAQNLYLSAIYKENGSASRTVEAIQKGLARVS